METRDKYKATWISHSSINDFLSCERLYFLKNVFKDTKSKRKINIASPHLSLGIAVHNTLEALKKVKTTDREREIKSNLLNNFNREWQKFKGVNGGFKNEEEERDFYNRGVVMIENLIRDPKYLLNKIVPDSYFYDGDMLPHYYINEKDNIILCGSIDWIEYLEDSKSMRIIDFKTGRNDEDDDSLQLPIYYLLIKNLDKKKIYKVSEFAYWYLDKDNRKEASVHGEFHVIKLDEEKLGTIKEKEMEIESVGKRMHKARSESLLPSDWTCPNEKTKGAGCIKCRDFEKVYTFVQEKNQKARKNEAFNNDLFVEKEIDLNLDLKKAEESQTNFEDVIYVGVSDYGQDLYYIKK